MAKKKVLSLKEKLEEALIPKEEQPYEIPKNWTWVKTSYIGQVITGNTPSKKEIEFWENGNFSFVKPKDLNQGRFLLNSMEFLTKKGAGKSRKLPRETTLICCIGTIGKSAFSSIECSTNQQINAIVGDKRLINNLFIYYFSKTPTYKELLWNKSTSTTISMINKSRMESLPFIMPPLEEQKRIVNKIESMLSKTKQAKGLISKARETSELRRASILHKAFTGELTKEWREENSGIRNQNVDDLLKKINVEKMAKWEEECKKAGEEGKRKPKKPVIKPVEEMKVPLEEQPYELPEGWAWVKLEEISNKITDGEHSTPIRTENGYYLLSARNIKNNKIDLKKVDYVGESEFERIKKRCNPEKGDILISCSGSVGRVAVVDKSNNYVMVRSVALVKISNINPKLLMYILESPTLQKSIREKSKSTAQSNLFLGSIKQLEIPLSPLLEQKEIVKKIEAMLEAEEKVKELLDMENQIELLEKSILSKAFRGELETSDPNDETAMELLRRVLEEGE